MLLNSWHMTCLVVCMMQAQHKIIKYLIGMLLVAFATSAQSKGRFGELIIPLYSKRPLHYEAKDDRSLVIMTFKQTKVEELEPLNLYDERLIKRLIIKDFGKDVVKVFIYLKDKDLRALIQEFEQPYRVSLSIYDKNYMQERDPKTSLPLPNLGYSHDDSAGSTSPVHGLAQTDDAVPIFTKKLMQSSRVDVQNQDWTAVLAETPEGRGKSWKDFPVFIYPLPLAAQHLQDSKTSKLRANNEHASLSEQALNYFILGDENRALVLYQKVLFTDPTIFDRDPKHLWALAEINFGRENLQLADGYYDGVIQKFPETSLAKFAHLRRLDITLLKSIAEKLTTNLPILLEKLSRLKTHPIQELRAQILIREIFLNSVNLQAKEVLPGPTEAEKNDLQATLPKLESKRTAFLAESLILKSALVSQALLKPDFAKQIDVYLRKFEPSSSEPFYQDLKFSFEEKATKDILLAFKEGKYQEAVTFYEMLTPLLKKSISENADTALALAQSYQRLDRKEKSLAFFRQAATIHPDKNQQFKAQFLGLTIASELAKKSKRDDLKKISREFDGMIESSWATMSETEKATIRKDYRKDLESLAAYSSSLKSYTSILFEILSAEVSQNTASEASVASDAKAVDLGNTVKIIHNLSQRYRELGLKTQRRDTVALLKSMTPKSFESDTVAKTLWVNDLVNLAEEFRKEEEFSQSGRIYSYAGEHALDWEKRAEALYKGGILLLRAGRREEAVKAFNLASQDPNNMFYARIAKERLDQLNK